MTIPLHPTAGTSYAREPWAILTACVVLTAVPLMLDLTTSYINVPIVLILPLVVCARLGRPALLVGWATTLVLVTYGSYLAEILYLRPAEVTWFRVLNRTLVATTIVAVTALLLGWMRLRRAWRGSADDAGHAGAGQDQDDHVHAQVADSVEQILAGLVVLAYVGAVAVADLVTPGQYNLPILYAAPLLLAGLVGSRWFLWGLCAMLLALTVAGFFIGRQPTTDLSPVTLLLTNRSLVILVILGIAAYLSFWMKPASIACSGGSVQAVAPNG